MSDLHAEPAAVQQRVSSLLQLGRFEQALAMLGPALAQAPDEPVLIRQAAVALLELDRPDEALRQLTHAVALTPSDPALYRLMSLAYRQQGDAGAAYRAAVESTRLDPYAAASHLQVAASAVLCGDQATAVHAAEYAVQLEPDDVDTHLVLAETLHPDGVRPPKADLARIEDHLRRALQLDPDNPAALNGMARLAMARGQYAKAAGHLSSSVRAAPQLEVLHQNMDGVLINLVGVCHWVLFLVWFVGARLLGGFAPQRWFYVVPAVAGLAVLATIAVKLGRQIPASMRAGFVRGFVRRQRLGAAWAGCLALTAACFIVSAVLPIAAAQAVFACAIAPLIAGAVLSWVRYYRARR